MRLKLVLQNGARTSLQIGDLIEHVFSQGWRVRRYNGDTEIVVLFMDAATYESRQAMKIYYLKKEQTDLIATLFATMAGLDIEQVSPNTWRCIADK